MIENHIQMYKKYKLIKREWVRIPYIMHVR